MSPLWNSLPESAIIQDVNSGLPADTVDGPACGDMTAQTLVKCSAHAIRRYARLRIAKPFRRMLIRKLHPKCRRVDVAYYDWHTRGEIL